VVEIQIDLGDKHPIHPVHFLCRLSNRLRRAHFKETIVVGRKRFEKKMRELEDNPRRKIMPLPKTKVI
jgi:hypothetical protein